MLYVIAATRLSALLNKRAIECSRVPTPTIFFALIYVYVLLFHKSQREQSDSEIIYRLSACIHLQYRYTMSCFAFSRFSSSRLRSVQESQFVSPCLSLHIFNGYISEMAECQSVVSQPLGRDWGNQSQASLNYSPESIPVQSVWDLSWTEWHRMRFLSTLFGSQSPPPPSTVIIPPALHCLISVAVQ
jgi:hypothetical protein